MLAGKVDVQPKALRAHIRQLRKLLDEETLRENSRRICDKLLALPQYQTAHTIFAYLAMPGEADLEYFIDQARQVGKRVCVPVCLGPGEMVAALPEDALQSNRFGIQEPAPGAYQVILPAELDMIVLPCMAFDLRCNRMGHGNGYYDRYLATCTTNLFKVGVGLDFQLVEELSTQPWDVPADMVITQNRSCVRPSI